MKIKSRKDLFFSLIISGVVLLLIWILISSFVNTDVDIPLVVVLLNIAVIIFLLSLFFGTHYYLDEVVFKYRSGPFFGSIKVKAIKEIVVGKYLWVGMRPATAFGGLIIKYETFGELYISPQDNEQFINKILELNPNIKITRKS